MAAITRTCLVCHLTRLGLHRQKKLCLVLDLDHTLINSAHFPEVDAPTLAALQERLAAEASSVNGQAVAQHKLGHQQIRDTSASAVVRQVSAAGGRAHNSATTCCACMQAALPEKSRTLYHLPQISMWTKLRPGARTFLAQAASMFQLWIHTNSARCCHPPL